MRNNIITRISTFIQNVWLLPFIIITKFKSKIIKIIILILTPLWIFPTGIILALPMLFFIIIEISIKIINYE